MERWPIDGDLHAYLHLPDAPRAAVLLVHGFGEHAGRHGALAEALGRRGIAVYAYDQRGHGRSPGRRAVVERFDDWVDDALAMRRRVASRHPGAPLVVVGVSMGGVVAARSVQRDRAGVAGVVLVAPAFAVGGGTPAPLRALGRVVARVAPAWPIASLELAGLAHDAAVAAAYAADPLNHHGGVPARTAAELVDAAARALRDAGRWAVPTLIVHGDADRIAAPAGSDRFAAAAAAAGADVVVRRVAGGYHEPFNDAGGDALLAEVADWIVARAAAPDVRPASGADGDAPRPSASRYSWREGVVFGAAVNVAARLLGTNTGRYEALVRPRFAPPGWAFPLAWSINSALAIWGNVRVLNAPPSRDRTAYLRLWAATWLLYVSFGYVFFRRKSPVLGVLVTTNFLTLTVLSAARAVRIDRRLWISYATLVPWLVLAAAVAGAVALDNPDPLLGETSSADGVTE